VSDSPGMGLSNGPAIGMCISYLVKPAPK